MPKMTGREGTTLKEADISTVDAASDSDTFLLEVVPDAQFAEQLPESLLRTCIGRAPFDMRRKVEGGKRGVGDY